MCDTSDAQLLGYLLGALDETESEELESALRCRPELYNRLLVLKATLGQLDAVLDAPCERAEPPEGLAQRACQRVETVCGLSGRAGPAGCRHPRARHVTSSVHFFDGGIARSTPSVTWLDVTVGTVITGVVLLLVFPAIQESRTQSRINACQRNLQRIYMGLATYSDQFEGQFPAPPFRGKMAVAGAYGPMLLEGGYIDSPETLFCPDSPQAAAPHRIPSTQDVLTATAPETIRQLQSQLGGSYGYTLGYSEGGRHHSPRNLSRATYVLMADAPVQTDVRHASSNHGGRGQNVLFEDGRVSFVTATSLPARSDHFFLNDSGRVAPGVHRDDSVVAASGVSFLTAP